MGIIGPDTMHKFMVYFSIYAEENMVKFNKIIRIKCQKDGVSLDTTIITYSLFLYTGLLINILANKQFNSVHIFVFSFSEKRTV